jgi:Zn-dependent peptidase ImmA (M78 family)
VALVSAIGRPLIFVNSRYEGGSYQSVRRFTLAHELCHLLIDRDAGKPLALASGPWAPRSVEQRANAFAAALLMPNGLLQVACRSIVGDRPPETLEQIETVADAMQVGTVTLVDHLGNVDLIDHDVHDELRVAALRRIREQRMAD